MRELLSILAMFGLAACSGTATGGAAGGTTHGTTGGAGGSVTSDPTTTVSVACTDCLSQTITWGYTGFMAYEDTASLGACRSYQHTRTAVGGEDAGSSQSCSGEIGGCDAGAHAVHDVEQALAQPDVIAALAGSVPVYGDDPRPCDGAVLQIKVGTQTLTVGGECGPTASCVVQLHACVPVPAGVRALANVLIAVDQASLEQGECATTFP